MIPIRARPKLGAIPDQNDLVEVPVFPLDCNDFLGAGTPPFQWTDQFQGFPTLPNALFIDKDTGIISGTGLAPGAFSVTIEVRNATGLSRSTFTWTFT